MASYHVQGVLWRRDPRRQEVAIVANGGTKIYQADPEVFEQFRRGRIQNGTCVQCQVDGGRIVSLEELLFTSGVEDWNEETAYVRCPFVPQIELTKGDKVVRKCRIIKSAKNPNSKHSKLPFDPAMFNRASAQELAAESRLDFCSSIALRNLQRTGNPPFLDVLPIKMTICANEPREHQRYYEPMATTQQAPNVGSNNWMQRRMGGSNAGSESGSVASSVMKSKRGKPSTPKSRPRKKKKVARSQASASRWSRPGSCAGSRRGSRSSQLSVTPRPPDMDKRPSRPPSEAGSAKKARAYIPPHKRKQQAALKASPAPPRPTPPSTPPARMGDSGLGLSLDMPDLPEALDSDNELNNLSNRSGHVVIHMLQDNLPTLPPMSDEPGQALQALRAPHQVTPAPRKRLSLTSPINEALPQLPPGLPDMGRISLRSNISQPADIPGLRGPSPRSSSFGGFHAPHTSRTSLDWDEQTGQRSSGVSERLFGMFQYRPSHPTPAVPSPIGAHHRAPATPPDARPDGGRRRSAQSDPGPSYPRRGFPIGRITPSTSTTHLPLLPEGSPAGSTHSERFSYPEATWQRQRQWQSGEWNLDPPSPRRGASKLRVTASEFVPGGGYTGNALARPRITPALDSKTPVDGHKRDASWNSAFTDEPLSRQNTGQSMSVVIENAAAATNDAGDDKPMERENTQILEVPRDSLQRMGTLDSNNRQSTFNTNMSSMSISRPSTLTQMQGVSQSSLSVPRMSGNSNLDLAVIPDNETFESGAPKSRMGKGDGKEEELLGKSLTAPTDDALQQPAPQQGGML